ncbi:MAG: sigma factor [Chitinophagaceae bacterium]
MSRNFTPEETLIDQLFLDDTDAFEELYHRYSYPLYAYCAGKLDSPADAKQIVRDVFIALWEKRHSLPVGFSLSLYLYKEVRKALVNCINEKLETEKDLTRIQTRIIPGFAMINLQKARQPVRKSYSEMRYLQLLAKNNQSKTPWWNQAPAGITVKDIKQVLQKAFNLL